MWFLDFNIVNDLINYINNIYNNNKKHISNIVGSERLWETIIYKEYLYNNLEKYNYELYNLDNFFIECIPSNILNIKINNPITIDNFMNFVDFLDIQDLELLIKNIDIFSVFHINCGKDNCKQPKQKDNIKYVIKNSKYLNIVFGLNDPRFPDKDYTWILC